MSPYFSSMVKEKIMQRIEQRKLAESKSIPYYELQEKHIENLKVLVNRDVLLEKMPKNSVVAEIGVDKGEFSEMILSINNPQKLYLIDAWHSERYHDGLAQSVEKKFEKQIECSQVEIKRGLSTDMLKTMDNSSLDWVYIDTSHTYKTTFEELVLCNNLVKQAGIIAGHDFVTGQWEKGIRYGVIEAVHQFCVEYNWQMIYLTHETHRHLSFAIKRL